MYSLRSWISDLILWSASTDIDVHRQGPIAALQISGSARELVREIPPNVLQNGRVDPQTGNQVAGVMVLAETLVQRYAPLEAETAARAVSELMNFKKLHSETTDGFLVRFDILRNRAANRGGMALNWEGMGWLLLNALGASPEVWDRLMLVNDGRLPHNEQELTLLMERIRRMGHNYEGGFRQATHHGASGDPGQFFQQNAPGGFFPVFSGNWPNDNVPFAAPQDHQTYLGAQAVGGQSPPSVQSYYPNPSNQDHSQGVFNAWQDHGWSCDACGMYFEDDDISSATSSNVDNSPTEQFVSIEGLNRSDNDAVGNELYEAYLVARRRWRKFTGKPPRRYRKFSHRSDRQQRNHQRLSRGPFSGTYASFLPSSAFAGGKGKGKNKSKDGRKNPRGKDGKVLLCAKCGSDSHLWRQCPNGSGGKGQASPPSMAMLANICSLPGVSFSYMTSDQPQQFAISTPPQSSRGTGLDAELESLRSVSQASATRSRKQRSEGNESNGPRHKVSRAASNVPVDGPGSDASAVDTTPRSLAASPAQASNTCQFTASPVLASFMTGKSPAMVPESSRTDIGRPMVFRQMHSQWFPSQDSGSTNVAVVESEREHAELESPEMPGPSRRVPSSSASVHSSPADANQNLMNVSQNSFNSTSDEYRSAVPSFASHKSPSQSEWASPPQYMTPPSQSHSSAPQASPMARRTLRLSDLLQQNTGGYPWWDCPQNQSDPEVYHVRTRLAGQVGLLVDPGAHDNLIGSETAELMSQQLSEQGTWLPCNA